VPRAPVQVKTLLDVNEALRRCWSRVRLVYSKQMQTGTRLTEKPGPHSTQSSTLSRAAFPRDIGSDSVTNDVRRSHCVCPGNSQHGDISHLIRICCCVRVHGGDDDGQAANLPEHDTRPPPSSDRPTIHLRSMTNGTGISGRKPAANCGDE